MCIVVERQLGMEIAPQVMLLWAGCSHQLTRRETCEWLNRGQCYISDLTDQASIDRTACVWKKRLLCEGGVPTKIKGVRRARIECLIMRFPIGCSACIWLGDGERFLLLTHTGRSSGVPRQTILEVLQHWPSRAAFYVLSGWMERPIGCAMCRSA